VLRKKNRYYGPQGPKHPRYYNKFSKSDAWEELATEMKKTSDECKKKMTSLSASFRREKARMKKSQRTGSGNYKRNLININ